MSTSGEDFAATAQPAGREQAIGQPFQLSSLLALSSLHYWLTALLALLLVPLAASARLRFGVPTDLIQLFVVVSAKAIVLAAILHVIAAPLGPTLRSLRTEPVRLVMLAVPPAVLVAMLGWQAGLSLGLAAGVTLEFLSQTKGDRLRRIGSFLIPALYLFLGITLIWDYNDIVASFRAFNEYDSFFMRLDAWLGIDVPAISKEAVVLFSPRLLEVAEDIYYGMFVVLGAGVILIGLQSGRNRAMRFAGGALLAYYVALFCYAAFPSLGPFLLCSDHAASFPATLDTYRYQTMMTARASGLLGHRTIEAATGGYFISFPCMHVVKPTLVWWYLRHERRVAFLLFTYVLVLPVAIVLLEWHYVVDVLAGFAMAALAIFISDGRSAPAPSGGAWGAAARSGPRADQ